MPGNRFVLSLDAGLLLLFVVLLSPRITGLPVHECLGIALAGPVLLHLLLSWRWLVTATRRLFARSDLRGRVNYLLNGLLLVLVTVEVVTGIAISQAALPWIGVTTVNDGRWRHLHNMISSWLMLAAALHLAMNWTWVRAVLRRWRSAARSRGGGVPGRRRIVQACARTGVLLLVTGAIGAAPFAWLGPPSAAHVYRQNEIARFAGRPWIGIRQFALEGLLLCGCAWVARRWLRVRLEGFRAPTLVARSADRAREDPSASP